VKAPVVSLVLGDWVLVTFRKYFFWKKWR